MPWKDGKPEKEAHPGPTVSARGVVVVVGMVGGGRVTVTARPCQCLRATATHSPRLGATLGGREVMALQGCVGDRLALWLAMCSIQMSWLGWRLGWLPLIFRVFGSGGYPASRRRPRNMAGNTKTMATLSVKKPQETNTHTWLGPSIRAALHSCRADGCCPSGLSGGGVGRSLAATKSGG